MCIERAENARQNATTTTLRAAMWHAKSGIIIRVSGVRVPPPLPENLASVPAARTSQRYGTPAVPMELVRTSFAAAARLRACDERCRTCSDLRRDRCRGAHRRFDLNVALKPSWSWL